MRTTQEVWDHHVQGFVARDVPMVMDDFAESSKLIANGETYDGRDRIGEFFSGLFAELPQGCDFDLTSCIVLENNVYITWTAESESTIYEFATDTFTIEDGKISLQTIGYVKRAK